MKTICITTLSMFLLVGNAQAVKSLSTAELTSHCSYYSKAPKGKDAIFCVRYIRDLLI